MRIVLLPQCLVLSGIERDADGNIVRAFVENGGWYLVIAEGHWECQDEHGALMGSQLAQSFTELEVPAEIDSNYNAVIQWAKTTYPDRVDPELHNRDHT